MLGFRNGKLYNFRSKFDIKDAQTTEKILKPKKVNQIERKMNLITFRRFT